jgi:DNA polymerase-3 subunit delta'
MFNALVGNERVKELLRGMLRSGQIPGALLFAGPEGVGKKQFAWQLAKAAVCRNPQDGEACDVCPACERAATLIPLKESDKDAKKKITRTAHPDVTFVIGMGRNILVDQIRELENEAQFRPLEGRARFFLIDDADKMNEQASNALLKTLEEPAPTTHIVLITERPAGLLSTIRSRSQLVRFSPIERESVKAYLRGSDAAAEDLDLLAGIAAGSIGRATSLELEPYRARRELMLDVLTAASIAPSRARLLRLAEELNDAKRKDDFELYLDVLETLAVDVVRLTLDAPSESIANADLRPQLTAIAKRVGADAASEWIRQIERVRGQLKVNINRKVASDSLFLGMMVAA